MPIKLSYVGQNTKQNCLIFCDNQFKPSGLSKTFNPQIIENINKTIKSNQNGENQIIIFNINSSQKIIAIKIDKNQSSLENEKKGAKFYEFAKSNSILSVNIIDSNIREFSIKNKFFLNEFLHGAQLKSYEFSKYK